MSPFVSPSLRASLRWQAFLTGDELETIDFLPADYFRPWHEQESMMLKRARSIQKDSRGSLVFVISEVFYASGRRIPLVAFLDNLRTAVQDRSVNIIVDGTNAVGNRCLIQVDACWDSYVFSTQHWLMASESCGVVLWRAAQDDLEPEPPDAIRVGDSNAEAQLRALAGIAAAVEAIVRQGGVGFFFSRCEKVKCIRESLLLEDPHVIFQ